jgi:hypothetical protein
MQLNRRNFRRDDIFFSLSNCFHEVRTPVDKNEIVQLLSRDSLNMQNHLLGNQTTTRRTKSELMILATFIVLFRYIAFERALLLV